MGGRASAERRAANPGRRWTTVSPPHSLFNVEIGRGGAVRQPPPLPPAGPGLNWLVLRSQNSAIGRARRLLEFAPEKGPRFTYRARFLVRVRTPSASGFDP